MMCPESHPQRSSGNRVQFSEHDDQFMQHAMALAKQAEAAGEVPVGAVVVHDGGIIGEGYNRPIANHDPSAHAEIVAMRAAAKALTNYRLLNTTLYVTLEPCVMCIGAIVHARVKRLVYAAPDPKAGAVVSAFSLLELGKFNHQLDWQAGLYAAESAELLRSFFKARR